MNTFIKWAGGKRWLVEKHPELLPIPAPGKTYREPFVGGAAVFFGERFEDKAALSDVNKRLVDTYLVVRDRLDELVFELGTHPYEKDHYYKVRDRLNTEPDADIVERAAWFMVINRFGFNGMYRENKDGGCNIPFGRATNPTLCNYDALRACSDALQGASILCLDFKTALSEVEEGDAVFLDPPYVPASESANFTGYSAGGFTAKDQADLVTQLHRLDDIGARWTLTNSDTPETRRLYDGWEITAVSAKRSIAANGKKRADVGEIIVRGKHCAVTLSEAA